MSTVPIKEIVEYLEDYLKVSSIQDYPTALNGLQVEGNRGIKRVAVAVDAAQYTIDKAIEGGADLLLVHHGLFWDGNIPLTGRRYKRVKSLLEAGLAVYSSHLPLDVHPEVGNNAVIARKLGMEVTGTFGNHKGAHLGIWGEMNISRKELLVELQDLLGLDVKMIPGGSEYIKRVGIVSGGAASLTGEAAAAGLDAFITGEGTHHNYFDAEEGGINLYLGGHYATEVWGVKALAERLKEEFGIEQFFIDHPTGL